MSNNDRHFGQHLTIRQPKSWTQRYLLDNDLCHVITGYMNMTDMKTLHTSRATRQHNNCIYIVIASSSQSEKQQTELTDW